MIGGSLKGERRIVVQRGASFPFQSVFVSGMGGLAGMRLLATFWKLLAGGKASPKASIPYPNKSVVL